MFILGYFFVRIFVVIYIDVVFEYLALNVIY